MGIANPVSAGILIGVVLVLVGFVSIVLARKLCTGGEQAAAKATPAPQPPVLNQHAGTPVAPAPSANALIAVLAAAAYEALGQPVRIVMVRSVPDAWSLSGRNTLQASHKPRG